MENKEVKDFLEYSFKTEKERFLGQLVKYLNHKFPKSQIKYTENVGLLVDIRLPDYEEIMDILKEIGLTQD